MPLVLLVVSLGNALTSGVLVAAHFLQICLHGLIVRRACEKGLLFGSVNE